MNDIKYKDKNFNFAYRVSAIIYNEDETKILLFYGNNNNGDIKEEPFKSNESGWINFKWVEINKLNEYNIHLSKISSIINNISNHIVEEKK